MPSRGSSMLSMFECAAGHVTRACQRRLKHRRSPSALAALSIADGKPLVAWRCMMSNTCKTQWHLPHVLVNV